MNLDFNRYQRRMIRLLAILLISSVCLLTVSVVFVYKLNTGEFDTPVRSEVKAEHSRIQDTVNSISIKLDSLRYGK